jgi:N-acetylglucosaminyldiphosphoundecaprenol N-acetyl-beta-D-mannosaminyltransferase
MLPLNVKFLGVKATLFSREDLKEYLIQTIYDKGKFRVLFLDEKKMFTTLFSPEFKKIIKNTEIVLCASQTVAWIIKVLTGKVVPIIMPVTLFLDIMRSADEMNYTVFLFGGNQVVSMETLKRIKKSFGQARIVGNYRSNIKNKEMQDVLTTIRKSSPQIFFANYGKGAKQEFWISQNTVSYKNSIVIGVDNAFQIIAGKQKMPPLWFQKKEWNGFYRFLSRPYNVLRLFRIIVLFFITIFHKISKKK